MDTELMVQDMERAGYTTELDKDALAACARMAAEIFV